MIGKKRLREAKKAVRVENNIVLPSHCSSKLYLIGFLGVCVWRKAGNRAKENWDQGGWMGGTGNDFVNALDENTLSGTKRLKERKR